MADVRSTHDLHHPRNTHRGMIAVLLFLFVALMIAVFVAMVMNVHGTLSWPAGRIEFGLKSPLPQSSP